MDVAYAEVSRDPVAVGYWRGKAGGYFAGSRVHTPNWGKRWSRCLYISTAHSPGVRGPKKLWGCVVQPAGPMAVKRSINPHSRFFSVARSRSSAMARVFAVGEFLRIGSPSASALDFTNPPIRRPTNIRGGQISPTAHSIAWAQCATACAGFILPHCR